MSQNLEPTLKEAASKNLSLAATLESLVDLELESRNRRAESVVPTFPASARNPLSTAFASTTSRGCKAKAASSASST